MLENILLFAHRRVPLHLQLELPPGATSSSPSAPGSPSEFFDPETTKVLRETFNRSLSQIFGYYLNIAQSRRSHFVAAEKLKDHNAAVAYRDKIKAMKNSISYKEYMQVSFPVFFLSFFYFL